MNRHGAARRVLHKQQGNVAFSLLGKGSDPDKSHTGVEIPTGTSNVNSNACTARFSAKTSLLVLFSPFKTELFSTRPLRKSPHCSTTEMLRQTASPGDQEPLTLSEKEQGYFWPVSALTWGSGFFLHTFQLLHLTVLNRKCKGSGMKTYPTLPMIYWKRLDKSLFFSHSSFLLFPFLLPLLGSATLFHGAVFVKADKESAEFHIYLHTADLTRKTHLILCGPEDSSCASKDLKEKKKERERRPSRARCCRSVFPRCLSWKQDCPRAQ